MYGYKQMSKKIQLRECLTLKNKCIIMKGSNIMDYCEKAKNLLSKLKRLRDLYL